MKYIPQSAFSLLTLILFVCSCSSGSGDSAGDSSARTERNAGSTIALLGKFWEGEAEFIQTGAGFGSDFQLHFINAVDYQGELRAYYVSSPIFYGREISAATGLAVSADGISFHDQGEVLSVGGDLLRRYSAVDDFIHPDGSRDERCQGWSAGPEHSGGYLAAGSPSARVDPGLYSARFALTILGNPQPGDAVALIEVYDRDSGEKLSARDILVQDFPDLGIESSFVLEFNASAGSDLELRVFSYGAATVCFRFAALQSGDSRRRDDRIASFPSVVRSGSQWLMVYEGASRTSSDIHGEIRLAHSDDGITWRKSESPLLVPTEPWQLVNIGTPLLYKKNDTWFLFYHGFDGISLQLGAASGPALDSLVPVNNNQPILRTGDGWDSGTIGKRSIVYEEPYYYMVYEGSTLASDFSKASWGSGLARSQDLINWEKYQGNPILGPSDRGFGYDGPEFVRTPDGELHIYFRNMLGSTDRVTLVPR